MTKTLQRAFAEASKLSEAEQEAFGKWLLEELASQRRWDDALSRSRGRLTQMGAEALAEHRGGRSKLLDAEKL
jgi:hypothetical protein